MADKKAAAEVTTEFALDADMQAYVEILKITGQPFDLETKKGQKLFVIQYGAWVADGRPKPQPPKTTPVAIPIKLYREKIRGEQKMYWIDSNGNKHGKSTKIVTVQLKDSDGFPYEKRNEETVYNLPFSKTEADKILDTAMTLAKDFRCYFKVAGATFEVKSSDFTGDFEEIVRLQHTKNYV